MTAFARPSHQTLADALLRNYIAAANPIVANVTLVLLFAGITAASAQISIPLPFTPVPITGQTFGVLLAGSALGWRRGVCSMMVYLLCGAVGIPVFAGGLSGAARFLGPTGGYLIAYPIAAGIVGAFAQRGWDRRPLQTIGSMLAGTSIIYLIGVFWLSHYVGGISPAVAKGMFPFLPGDIAKLVLASMVLPGSWTLVSKIHGEKKSRGV